MDYQAETCLDTITRNAPRIDEWLVKREWGAVDWLVKRESCMRQTQLCVGGKQKTGVKQIPEHHLVFSVANAELLSDLMPP